ncbi:MAG: PDZ domain-containing protein [Myxococcales bacterium]|nr:PDZ domain-containing protein [Myxococcales bacterium]
MRQSPSRATFLVTGLVVMGLLSGAWIGRVALERIHAPYASVALVARVLAAIEADYVEPVPTEELVDAAIEGMVDHLDSQSRWLDHSQLRALRNDPDAAPASGLGLDIAPSDSGVRVVRVVEGSPAARTGVIPGDRILQVDGQDLQGLPLHEVEQTFHGAQGPHGATLTVLREGWTSPRRLRTAQQQRPATAGVRAELLPSGIAYARLAHFQQGAAEALLAEVERVASGVGGVPSLSGLVVDVRDNPGGLLAEAVAVVDLFLDEGVIVRTRNRAADDQETHLATPGGFPTSLPTVVLINGMSASASEILAGALQDTNRGILVGERTYGKGTVQKLYLHRDSPHPSALKLTVGRYYTPSGAPVAPSEGRVPDIEVTLAPPPGPRTKLERRIAALALEEADRVELQALVAQLPKDRPRSAAIAWDLPVEERLERDPQLARAISVLTTSAP